MQIYISGNRHWNRTQRVFPVSEVVPELSESISVWRFWGFCILSDFSTSALGPGTPAKRSVSKNANQRYQGNVLNRIQSRDFEVFVFYGGERLFGILGFGDLGICCVLVVFCCQTLFSLRADFPSLKSDVK